MTVWWEDRAGRARRHDVRAELAPGRCVLVSGPDTPQKAAWILAALERGVDLLLVSAGATPRRVRDIVEAHHPDLLAGPEGVAAAAGGQPTVGEPAVTLLTPDYHQRPCRVPFSTARAAAGVLAAALRLTPADVIAIGASLADASGFGLLLAAHEAGASVTLAARPPGRMRHATLALVSAAWCRHRASVLLRWMDDLPGAVSDAAHWVLRSPTGLARLARQPVARRVRRRLGPALRGLLVADTAPPDGDLFAALGMPVHVLHGMPDRAGARLDDHVAAR